MYRSRGLDEYRRPIDDVVRLGIAGVVRLGVVGVSLVAHDGSHSCAEHRDCGSFEKI